MSISQTSQVRVRFFTQHTDFAITDSPFSLPAKLGRQGLSEVINHLLGNSNDNFQPFDFIVNNHLVRSPLYKFLSGHRINVEDIVEIEYFPALSLAEESDSIELPAWIGSIDSSNLSSHQLIFAGCYDGSLKSIDGSKLATTTGVTAHDDPIKAITTWCDNEASNMINIATASKDQNIKIWSYDLTMNKFVLGNILKGHMNSVESVCHWNSPLSNTGLIVSGDWGGSLAAWKLSTNKQSSSSDHPPSKKRKDNKGHPEPAEVSDIKPLFVLKAHQQSISSVCVVTQSNNAFTASWDHSIKKWDLDRQDCINTLNCSKVVTSLDIDSKSGMLASSHPDGKVRIWDTRINEGNGNAHINLGKTVDWVSQVSSDTIPSYIYLFFTNSLGALEA